MRDIMWTPPSPEKEEVVEETCVEINVQDKKAIPFFTHDSGCICIQGKKNKLILIRNSYFLH